MQNKYTTDRLSLSKLEETDAEFIQDLVNTQGWLEFIGNRNVNSLDDATGYIRKILDNPNVTYWCARPKDGGSPIGIVTLIKRDYLDHPDIGFAFLPEYAGAGYAYEATATVIKGLTDDYSRILAITVKENHNSIRLLEKLGFSFGSEIVNDGESLQVFARETGITHPLSS